ncbi:MAG: ABC transporter ATP-binding protein [Saccharofermentans sp.]|nr:ABC transporter ATP-binding protein [Saccharofermentans sp.]
MINCRNVSKSFSSKKILKGINMDVKKGEIFGLLGPSGAGKTTLIKILTGQLKAEGDISILGMNPQSLKGDDYRKIGIMMDSFGVYERLSCIDNLRTFADIYGIPQDKVLATLEDVGLKDAAKTAAGKLSKGMRGRLQLARVFMQTPDIIFLDEPTSGLDPQTAESIRELISSKKEQGCTIFLTTHDMNEAAVLCNHLALLNEGRIVEYGTPEEICRRYNHQNKIVIHLYDGTDITLENDGTGALQIAELLSLKMVETIHSTEPNLETVFLELTGRGFCA